MIYPCILGVLVGGVVIGFIIFKIVREIERKKESLTGLEKRLLLF